MTLLAAEDGPKRRRLQALTDREARLRALARKGQRVRVTFEGEVVDAWARTDSEGVKHVQFMVLTPDGHRHIVNPGLPGGEVEGLPGAES
ncbi:hypothetical protein [Streptomyces sp. WM6372]|uniref:hypothetical protein n=1 Tax=Streptomyces sp. WM6372 TaxID=1415555 RepID=UPI00131CAFFB|nr:hypothetical protein [Streptomyces sp. WM6372]